MLLPLLLINGCTANVGAPVSARVEKEKPVDETKALKENKKKSLKVNIHPKNYHTVKKGNTLYSIAWLYDADYHDIASWNGISAPYIIYPGQKMKLQAPPERKSAKPSSAAKKEKTITKDKPKQPANIKQQITKKTTNQNKKPPLSSGDIDWSWPTQGELVKSDSPISKKGINISGKLGQKINAAAVGDVVYSGSGLLGYGKLIIIKHNDIFLSAYAHNNKLMVKEGDRVSAGQQIAQMGQANNRVAQLHFEIRKNGKPTNPINYLPKR